MAMSLIKRRVRKRVSEGGNSGMRYYKIPLNGISVPTQPTPDVVHSLLVSVPANIDNGGQVGSTNTRR